MFSQAKWTRRSKPLCFHSQKRPPSVLILESMCSISQNWHRSPRMREWRQFWRPVNFFVGRKYSVLSHFWDYKKRVLTGSTQISVLLSQLILLHYIQPMSTANFYRGFSFLNTSSLVLNEALECVLTQLRFASLSL